VHVPPPNFANSLTHISVPSLPILHCRLHTRAAPGGQGGTLHDCRACMISLENALPTPMLSLTYPLIAQHLQRFPGGSLLPIVPPADVTQPLSGEGGGAAPDHCREATRQGQHVSTSALGHGTGNMAGGCCALHGMAWGRPWLYYVECGMQSVHICTGRGCNAYAQQKGKAYAGR
jgi:hypothetical protein